MSLTLTNVGTALLILQHDVRKSGIKSNLCLSYTSNSAAWREKGWH